MKYLLPLLLLAIALPAEGQYFGRNKARYDKFEFEVYETPNFDIYHYLENDTYLAEFASWCQHWHGVHQDILEDTIEGKNPLILYSNHADFQQTNAISGQIGIGTGGVTEAFKNRVIMPIQLSRQQTHHVLGHELVHAFQYNLVLNGDSTSLQNLGNLPLWLVEGMAEYMSIGRQDAHTAMWMRDAVLNDRVPELKDLDNPEFFPYRYGQVFWAFLTGIYGDQVIEPFFMATAQYGIEMASETVLQIPYQELSNLWVSSLKDYFGGFIAGRKEDAPGRLLISPKNAGEMNIAPVLSPDGKYLIFLSEKNIFSADLFLADARTGDIIRQVASTARDGHIDDFDYIESAGTWSPDSRRFAFVGVKKGRNVLIIKEVDSGKTEEIYELREVPSFKNPAWSPDGKTIVVSGLVQGQTDLYSFELRTQKVKRITNDIYSELHPNWSADGQFLAYATDALSVERGPVGGKWVFNLAILDIANLLPAQIDVFPGADNLNPVFDVEGNLVFLSNRDGYRNIYRYERATGKVYQLTSLITGVSGITPYAPAITASHSEKRNRFLYTHFFQNGYRIYSARGEDFLNQEVDPTFVGMRAAMLPRLNRKAPARVDESLAQMDSLQQNSLFTFREKSYRPKFKLDYVGGSAGVGVGNTNFGTINGAAGGIDFLFSDILGDHQLLTSASLNGRLVDVAGVLGYINRKNRLSWGVSLSHIPYQSGQFGYAGIDTLQTIDGFLIPAAHYIWDEVRIFEDRLGIFAQWPFSTVLRVEAGASYAVYYNRLDRNDLFYDQFGFLIFQERNRLDPEEVGLDLFAGQLGSVNVALVGDNSYFGIASPLRGQRFRLAVERNFNGFGNPSTIGGFNFYNLTADYRRYIYARPVAFAFRAVHFGRYGEDSETLFPLFVGLPWNIRGYDLGAASEILGANGKSVDILFGSKLLVSNFEVRLPFTGPERLSLFRSRFLFTELALFADGGMAWTDFDQFQNPDPDGGPFAAQVEPVFSAGASLRVNLFGALIVEPYYAIPLQKETRGVWGLNLTPGW